MNCLTLPGTIATLLTIGVSLPIAARAQSPDPQSQQTSSQSSSVVEAARRTREKKKNQQSKSAKVITDDDLDRKNYPAGNEGLNVGSAPTLETQPPSSRAVAAAEAASSSAGQQNPKDAGDRDPEVARLKEQIADAEKDLDLDRRQLALDQDSYFSNPDHSRDSAGKTKLQDELQQIAAKLQEV